MNLLSKRFEELSTEADRVASTQRVHSHVRLGKQTLVDTVAFAAWRLKVRSLLFKACGLDSEHYEAFTAAENGTSKLSNFSLLKGIFLATKDDYDGGYLVSARQLLQAEVFSSELDQAAELLNKGYHVAAAVITGVVLETHLQELSRINGLRVGKIEAMNAELVKKGAYNVLRQKQITAYADLRNKAAHGISGFASEDVQAMMVDVGRFIAGQ